MTTVFHPPREIDEVRDQMAKILQSVLFCKGVVFQKYEVDNIVDVLCRRLNSNEGLDEIPPTHRREEQPLNTINLASMGTELDSGFPNVDETTEGAWDYGEEPNFATDLPLASLRSSRLRGFYGLDPNSGGGFSTSSSSPSQTIVSEPGLLFDEQSFNDLLST
jgi:hypothetical protein